MVGLESITDRRHSTTRVARSNSLANRCVRRACGVLRASPRLRKNGFRLVKCGSSYYRLSAVCQPDDLPAVQNPQIMARPAGIEPAAPDRKSTRLNSSHTVISYAVF